MTGFLQFFSRIWVALLMSTYRWPQWAKKAVARFLAWLLWWLVPARRHVTLTNLRLCFPDKTEAERKALARDCYRCLARAVIDHGFFWRASAQEIRSVVKVDDALRQALEDTSNQPLLIITGHFAGLDAAGIYISTFKSAIYLYQEQSNAVWDKAVYDGRMRFKGSVLVRKNADGSGHDIRKIIRSMREGHPFCYLPDMDYGTKNGTFINFFGVPAATITTASRLAKISRAKVFFGAVEMTEDGYYLHIRDLGSDFPTEDPVADTERITRELERWILRFPEQYMWLHRRFKHRPEGEESVYRR